MYWFLGLLYKLPTLSHPMDHGGLLTRPRLPNSLSPQWDWNLLPFPWATNPASQSSEDRLLLPKCQDIPPPVLTTHLYVHILFLLALEQDKNTVLSKGLFLPGLCGCPGWQPSSPFFSQLSRPKELSWIRSSCLTPFTVSFLFSRGTNAHKLSPHSPGMLPSSCSVLTLYPHGTLITFSLFRHSSSHGC